MQLKGYCCCVTVDAWLTNKISLTIREIRLPLFLASDNVASLTNRSKLFCLKLLHREFSITDLQIVRLHLVPSHENIKYSYDGKIEYCLCIVNGELRIKYIWNKINWLCLVCSLSKSIFWIVKVSLGGNNIKYGLLHVRTYEHLMALSWVLIA